MKNKTWLPEAKRQRRRDRRRARDEERAVMVGYVQAETNVNTLEGMGQHKELGPS